MASCRTRARRRERAAVASGLAGPDAPFQLRCEDQPIYSRARFLSPSRFEGATIRRSLIADGCSIEEGAVIGDDVVVNDARLGKGSASLTGFVRGLRDREIEKITFHRGDPRLRRLGSAREPRHGEVNGRRLERQPPRRPDVEYHADESDTR